MTLQTKIAALPELALMYAISFDSAERLIEDISIFRLDVILPVLRAIPPGNRGWWFVPNETELSADPGAKDAGAFARSFYYGEPTQDHHMLLGIRLCAWHHSHNRSSEDDRLGELIDLGHGSMEMMTRDDGARCIRIELCEPGDNYLHQLFLVEVAD
jgi:hypothetical protein